MPSLTDAEKVALQQAVSVHGRDWGAIAATGALGARTPNTILQAWDALSAHCITAAKVVVANPELAPLVAGPESAVARLPEALGRQAARRIHSGRPWDYIVRRGGKRQAPREPTALQKKWIKNWSLHNARGRGLLLCNLRRASAKLRKYFGQQGYTHATMDELMEHVPIPSKLRDELGMVLFPGDPGATVTRSCAGLNWLGGEDAGEGRFVTSREVAGFMGVDAHSGPYCVAKRYYTDKLI